MYGLMTNLHGYLTMPNNICIYHAHCTDGFGAAWVMRHRFKTTDEECIFIAGDYANTKHLDAIWDKLEGADVYLVDFSYKRAKVEAILKVARSVTVIDHHKTAIEDLRGLIQVYPAHKFKLFFKMENSGAILAWQYCFGTEPAPRLLHNIQDQDLWTFNNPQTRNIMMALRSHEMTFELWDTLMLDNPIRQLDTLFHEGIPLARAFDKRVQAYVNDKTLHRSLRIGKYVVPLVNCPHEYASDVGAGLCAGLPFAATYYDTKDYRKFSLRSDKITGIDVAEVAKIADGGGHAQAAGFVVPSGDADGIWI